MSDATENKKELDSYGVWVKHPASQDAESGSLATDVPGFADADASSLNTILPFSSPSDEAGKKDDFDIPAFDASSFDSTGEAAVKENDAGDDAPINADSFDVMNNFDGEMSAVPQSVKTDFSAESGGGNEGRSDAQETSAQSVIDKSLVEQIIAELAGIRKEIIDLKDKLGMLKKHEEAEAEDSSSMGGFFSDLDEDETIALSGDELDNIMTTAEFSSDEEKSDEDTTPNAESASADVSVGGMDSDTTLSDDELGNIMNTADFADDQTQNEGEAQDGMAQSAEEKQTAEPITELGEETLQTAEPAPNLDNGDKNVEELDKGTDGELDEVHEELPDEISLSKTADIFIEPQSDSADSNGEATDNIFIEPSPADFIDADDELMNDGSIFGASAVADAETAPSESEKVSELAPVQDEPQTPPAETTPAESEETHDIAASENEAAAQPAEEPHETQPTIPEAEPATEPLGMRDEIDTSADHTFAQAAEPETETNVLETQSANEPLETQDEAKSETQPAETVSTESEEVSAAAPTETESEAQRMEAVSAESEAPSTPVNVDDYFKAETSAGELHEEGDDYPVESEEENKVADEESKKESASAESAAAESLPANLREEIKSVLLYMDKLLESLPEEKIVEFAKSDQFATYKKLFSELGLS